MIYIIMHDDARQREKQFLRRVQLNCNVKKQRKNSPQSGPGGGGTEGGGRCDARTYIIQLMQKGKRHSCSSSCYRLCSEMSRSSAQRHRSLYRRGAVNSPTNPGDAALSIDGRRYYNQ